MKLQLPTSLLVLGLVVLTSTPVATASTTTASSASETAAKTVSSTTVSENTTVNGEPNPTPTTEKEEATTDNTTASNIMTSTASSNTTASPATEGSPPTSPGDNSTDSSNVTPSSPVTEENPNSTTPSQVTSTPSSATTPVPSTTPPTPSTPLSSSTPTTSSTPVAVNVTISETNFLLGSEPFVELRGTADSSLRGLTVAIFSGTSGAEEWTRNFDNSSSINSGGIFFFQPDGAEKVQKLTSVVLALYQTEDYSKSFQGEGLVDFAVFSTDPNASIDKAVQEIVLPEHEPLTIVRKELASSQNLSLSRCGEVKRSASMFVLATESGGQVNLCSMTPNSTTWTLRLHGKEDNCIPSAINGSVKQEVENKLVEEINRRCQCALTTLLVHSNLTCAQDLFLDFFIEESYENQGQQVVSAFISFTSDSSSLTVGNQEYSVVNCTSNCHAVPPHHPPKHDKANTSVTVAVVLSCVAAFLIILVSVVLYMRGKRRGIVRQFRMTRLQEDDDMDDMDDFIGSGGEPSFSARSSR